MRPRIMVVEDEAAVALNIQRTLIKLGYDVPRIAASHDQAIKSISETKPDLVLMDINISGKVDGIATASMLATPVIYLSAYSEQSTLDRAKKTAPYGYLVKPYSERELHATIQMALERRRIENKLAASERRLSRTLTLLESHADELFRHKERLLVTLNAIAEAVITTDQKGVVNYLNPVAEKLTGWRAEEAIGKLSTAILDLRDQETRLRVASPIETLLVTGRKTGLPENCVLTARDGSTAIVEESTALIRDRDTQVIGSVLVLHDVSATRRLAAEMTYQATHDSLTGLINRIEFERRLTAAIASARTEGRRHALAYIDLDQFKIVNDTCGHAAGDELLRQIAITLRGPLRASDTLARLGGDEFGMLLECCPDDRAREIAESMKAALNDCSFVWQDRGFPVGASIGLVCFGGAEHAAADLSDLLRIADSACYMAKEAGRNQIHVYSPGDQLIAQRHSEMDWYTRIHAALKEDHFVLYSQRIGDLREGGAFVRHCEILLRLRDGSGRIIAPMAFIPAAERYGLMREIDQWVIATTLRVIAERLPQDSALYGINLSGTTLASAAAQRFILDQLAETGVRPDCICFEITETAAITNILTAGAFIAALRDRGCKFALDDFGSGMASFSYLKHLPVDYLKIDGSFVKDMANNPIDAAMVMAINAIAHKMGIRTIAEFAESQTIVDMLTAGGVDYAQGYGLGLPEPL